MLPFFFDSPIYCPLPNKIAKPELDTTWNAVKEAEIVKFAKALTRKVSYSKGREETLLTVSDILFCNCDLIISCQSASVPRMLKRLLPSPRCQHYGDTLSPNLQTSNDQLWNKSM